MSEEKKPSDNGSPNPFDLASLRTPPDYRQTGAATSKRHHITAKERAPKDKFFQVHPFDVETQDWCLSVTMFTDDEGMEKTNYVVPVGTPAYIELCEMTRQFLVVAAITRKGQLFLWELKLPDSSKSSGQSWAASRLQVAQDAVRGWVAIENVGESYESRVPDCELPPARWPDIPFEKMIELAYRGRIIREADHQLIKDYYGRA